MTPAVPTLAPLALAGFLPLSALALEADADLETCQRWHERIEHYTRLRRAGGSSLQMERWRQARKRYEEQFRDARCHRWGRKLRD
ncbi:MAG TPA: hypothetical protein VJ947_02195 [Pseudohaliea sp.]|nr:hypothetical protein [Pseudohaliea sp.]